MSKMECPECQHSNTAVYDTRASLDNTIRRRRACPKCNARWSTIELSADKYAHMMETQSKLRTFAEIALGNYR